MGGREGRRERGREGGEERVKEGREKEEKRKPGLLPFEAILAALTGGESERLHSD